jgi:hypothetical protein
MISISQLFGLFAVMIAFVLIMSSADRVKAPRRSTFTLRGLPTGTYEIQAVRLESSAQLRPSPSVIGQLEVISHAH